MQIHCLEVGTCSDRALGVFLENNHEAYLDFTIKRADSFENCRVFAESSKASLLLVPHLHSIAGTLSLASGWELVSDKIFTLKNPPIYLAARTIVAAGDLKGRTCASLETLAPLIDKRLGLDVKPAKNTQHAARQVVELEADCCVTNQRGIEFFELSPIVELNNFTVVWLPFLYRPK